MPTRLATSYSVTGNELHCNQRGIVNANQTGNKLPCLLGRNQKKKLQRKKCQRARARMILRSRTARWILDTTHHVQLQTLVLFGALPALAFLAGVLVQPARNVDSSTRTGTRARARVDFAAA